MANAWQGAWQKAKCDCWLAAYLSVWLAVAYLWVALFFPLMCAPYAADAYFPIDPITASGHTVFEYTMFEYTMPAYTGTPDPVSAGTSLDGSHLIRAATASNAVWLLDSHSDVTGVALTLLSVISLPVGLWLLWSQPKLFVTLLHAQSYEHLQIAPPQQPPRFACV